MYRLLWLFLFFPWPSRGQTAPVTRQDNQVHFRAPVEVYFRLNSPVAEAEYVLVMEAVLVPALVPSRFRGCCATQASTFRPCTAALLR